MWTQKIRVGGFVLATAIGLAACTGQSDTPPTVNATAAANDPATESPAGPAAVDVANGFIDAYGSFDAQKAMTFVADDADLTGLVASQVPADADGLGLMLAFLEAEGYEQDVYCEPSTATTDTSVICTFGFQAIGSDEIGKGPFTGNSFTFSIRDGEIVQASLDWDTEKFSPQMWEPFAEWVSTTYPEDAAVMYEDETLSNFRLTRESIRLWGRRTREYARLETPEAVDIAERFMAARNAGDTEQAMSQLAPGGARVMLLEDLAMSPNMGLPGRLDRDELASALEAERVYGVRYNHVDCRHQQPGRTWGDAWGAPRSANVICSYAMDSTLRRIQGYRPDEGAFGLRVRAGRIDLLSFPWLNVSFPANVPNEGWKFAQWLQAEHPKAGRPGFDGRLFHTEGQELLLNLTPMSTHLLKAYLGEYERSVNS